MRQNRQPIFCWAALLVLWGLFHHRILFQGHTEVLLDASRFFYPLWAWGAGVWRQGLIPLWNPDAAFGTPYLADPQMAAWYPPLVIAYSFLTPTIAFSFLTVLHHLWALAGFFLFARNRGFSSLVALAGCLVFGFSFNAVSLAWITSILFAFSWIPWVLLAADRLREGKPGSVFFLLTAFAMQLAAGYPLYAYLTGLMVGGDWLIRWRLADKKGRRVEVKMSRWAWGLAAAGLAVLYNAAWLLPLKEMIPYSNLGQRLSMAQGMDWGNLTTWLNPFAHGHPLFSHPGTPFSYTVYFAGLPTVVLVLWGILLGKIQRHSLVLFLVVFVLSLGGSAYVGEWLKHFLPGYDLVVRSGYWISFVVFMVAVLLMESTEGIQVGDKRRVLWMGITLFIYGCALGFGVPWGLWPFWASLFLLMAAGFGSWHLQNRFLLIVLALGFSLGPVDRGIHFTLGKSYYDPPAALLGMISPGRLYQSPQWVDSFQTVSGKSVSDVYQKQKEDLIPNLLLAFGCEEISFANPLFLKSFGEAYLYADGRADRGRQGFLDYFGARYVQGEGGLIENKAAFTKWFSVQRGLEFRAAGNTVVPTIAQVGDFAQECVVSDGARIGIYSPRSVTETSRFPSRVALVAKGKGKALLVSSETAYPGWKANINGTAREWSLVNGGFRGIELKAGEEEVVWSYRPTSFKLGCFLSLLVCGVWLGMLLNLGWKNRYA